MSARTVRITVYLALTVVMLILTGYTYGLRDARTAGTCETAWYRA